MRKQKAKESKRDLFSDWVYRKHVLARWLDLQGGRILSKSCKSKSHEKAFEIILDTRVNLACIVNYLVFNRKCIVDCGSVCCYFPGRRGLGVYAGPDEAERISKALRESGLDERDYLKAVNRAGKSGHFIRLDAKRRIPKRRFAQSPKLLSGKSLWNKEDSLACIFLGRENRCGIYDIRPRSCRDFICTTGAMVSALFSMGLISPSCIEGMKTPRVNKLAGKARLLFTDEGLRELDREITQSFIGMVKIYLKSGRGLEGKIDELMELGLKYDKRRQKLLGGGIKTRRN